MPTQPATVRIAMAQMLVECGEAGGQPGTRLAHDRARGRTAMPHRGPARVPGISVWTWPGARTEAQPIPVRHPTFCPKRRGAHPSTWWRASPNAPASASTTPRC